MTLKHLLPCCALLLTGKTLATPVYNDHAMVQDHKIFYSHIQVNQNIKSGSNSGDDMFLLEAERYSGQSNNIDFRHYDDNRNLYWSSFTLDWELKKIDDAIQFVLDDYTLSHPHAPGQWEGLGIWTQAFDPNKLFYNASLGWTVTSWNNTALPSALSQHALLGENQYIELYDDEFANLTQMSGTLSFAWMARHNGRKKDVPGSHLSITMKGLDYRDRRFDATPIDNANHLEQTDVSVSTGTVGAAGILMIALRGLRRTRKTAR